jgi:hypothetical protein
MFVDRRRAFHTAKMRMIRAMEKITMAAIQITGIAVGLFDDPESEDERVVVDGVGVVCSTEVVESRGVKVVMVDRVCEEREAENDEIDERLGGSDEVVKAEIELVKDGEERNADCVE